MAFKNADRFRAKIKMLSPTLQSAVRQAMAQTAQQIVDAMRDLVPVDTGRLRDSIKWCWGDPPKNSKLFTAVGAEPATSSKNFKISIFAGDFDAFYARWVEFGTHAHAPGSYRDDPKGNHAGKKHDAGKYGHAATPAHPFFYPVWRAYKGLLRKNIAKILNAAIRQMAVSNG